MNMGRIVFLFILQSFSSVEAGLKNNIRKEHMAANMPVLDVLSARSIA